MSILLSELLFYKSAVVSDAAANGGRMGELASLITEAVKNNVWPNVTQAERAAGFTKYRKIFAKVENDDDLTLFDSNLFVETFTPAEGRILAFLGTQRDTQGDLTGSERLYGAGQLAADVIVGASSITVNCEDGADVCFQDSDLIRISDMPDVNGAGNQEYLRLAAVSGAVYVGDQVTLTFDTGVVTAYAYLAVDTRVASVIEKGDVKALFDNKAISSASGTYDEVTYPLILDNIGTIEETWTFTFTSATTFDVIGDTVGSVGSGNITTNFSPINGDFTKPYFTLDFNGWGGTWAIGDTFSFQSHPAAVPIWEKYIVPAGAASYSNNTVDVAIDGESE